MPPYGAEYDGPPAGNPDYAPCAVDLIMALPAGGKRTTAVLVVMAAAYVAAPRVLRPPLAVVLKGIFHSRGLIFSTRMKAVL